MDLLKRLWQLRPLVGEKRQHLMFLSNYLNRTKLRKIKLLINDNRLSFTLSSLGLSKDLGKDLVFPTLELSVPDKKLRAWVDTVNSELVSKIEESMFDDFATKAEEVLPKFVAPKLHGLTTIKQAIALQMFAKEKLHILLLGDPGTGKTEFLQSVEKLYPVTSFGLGSGTSGVGLSVTVKGNKVLPGLLPMANNGICIIDELNLMKKEDYAALYSAMEKGFVSYDKGGSHYRFDANIRLLATANPIGDKFRGNTRDAIVRQLPFEPALLSRFTLVFLIRKPDLKTFIKIAEDIVDKSDKKLSQGDIDFIQHYITYAEGIEPKFPKRLKQLVVEFARDIKLQEDKLFFDVSPRLIHGLINISKSYAKLKLKDEVTKTELEKAKILIMLALENKLESS